MQKASPVSVLAGETSSFSFPQPSKKACSSISSAAILFDSFIASIIFRSDSASSSI